MEAIGVLSNAHALPKEVVDSQAVKKRLLVQYLRSPMKVLAVLQACMLP